MQTRVLATAALAMTAMTTMTAAAAATCSTAGVNALTMDCADQCSLADQSCVAYAVNATVTEHPACASGAVGALSQCMPPDYACQFQCFLPFGGSDSTVFKFFLPFGAWQSEQEKVLVRAGDASWQQAVKALADTSADVPWQSNDFVKRVGALDIPASITTVVIAGGRDESGVKGKVVDVELAADLLLNAATVVTVQLANLNVATRLPSVASVLPTTTESLTLANCLFESVPTDLATLTSLTTLNLDLNYLTVIPSSAGMESVTALSAKQNNLTDFEAEFPNLRSLDLSDNAFAEVPLAIGQMSTLESLRFTANPLQIAVLTTAQYKVLHALKTLELAEFASDASSCDSGSMQDLSVSGGHVRVCVTTEAEFASMTATARRDAASDQKETSSSSSSSSTTMIAILVVAGVVVVAIIAFVWYRRRNAGRPAGMNGTAANGGNGLCNRGSVDKNEADDSEFTMLGDEEATAVISGHSHHYSRDHQEEKKQDTTGSGSGDRASRAKTDTGTGSTHRSGSGSHYHSGSGSGSGSGSATLTDHTIEAPKRFKEQRAHHGTSLWDDDDLLACQVLVDEIDDIRLIGSGGYGVVWLVKYRRSRLLASKRLVRDQITRQRTRAFVGEIKLCSTLHHPSIVEFVGVAWTMETDLQALFEYMPNGDLRSYLDATAAESSSRRGYQLDTTQDNATASDEVAQQDTWENNEAWQIALAVVEALVYVHSFNPPLVHRDLKSRNVLLGEDMKAKLSDFGVSRFESENATMTTGVGTGKWLAPEVISGNGTYDVSCDMYSFGVLLSELDTHAIPYLNMRSAEGHRLPEVAILQLVASGQVRPEFTAACPPEILEIAQQCLAFHKEDRPTAVEVAFRLRTIASQRGMFCLI